jgi:hypothetical protein
MSITTTVGDIRAEVGHVDSELLQRREPCGRAGAADGMGWDGLAS